MPQTKSRRGGRTAERNRPGNQTRPGSQTPNTPDADETDLRAMKVDDLRRLARSHGVGGTSMMRKDDLVKTISTVVSRDAKTSKSGTGRAGTGSSTASSRGRAKSGGRATAGGEAGTARSGGGKSANQPVRRGRNESKSVKYSQEINSPEEEPERQGRSLVTRNHEVIRQWAEERDGTPATVTGTEHGDRLGVLRFDFPPGDSARLRRVSWDEWFATFDERGLNFIYQEERSDGRQSTFFRLENPDREDA